MDPQVMRLSSCCVWGHAGGKGLQIGDLTVLPDSHTVQSMSRNCLTLYLNYHNVVLKCQLQSVIPGEKQTFSLTWTIKNYVEEYYQELLWSFFFSSAPLIIISTAVILVTFDCGALFAVGAVLT